MPESCVRISEGIWRNHTFPQTALKFYSFKDVFVAAEGLVFEQDGSLIQETQTQHSEKDVLDALGELSRPDIRSLEKCVLCKKRGAQNYGHWVMEMLPKAFFALQVSDLEGFDFMAPLGTGRLHQVIDDSLSMIGVPRHRQVLVDQGAVFVSELIVIDGLTRHGRFMSPLVFECIDFMSDQVPANDRYPFIYVSREFEPCRKFVAENAIQELLLLKGFSILEPGSMTLREQISAFKSARCVIGPMGAGMSNVAFSMPGCQVIMFMPQSALETFYWWISSHRKLEYHEIRCQEEGPQVRSLPWNRNLNFSSANMAIVLEKLVKPMELS